MAKVTVYYNSACPVCNAGIKGQRRRMEDCPTQVEWIDIHNDAAVVNAIGGSASYNGFAAALYAWNRRSGRWHVDP